MKKGVTPRLLAAFLLGVLFWSGADARPQDKDFGAIEKIEFSTISRETASLWVRASLPKVARGWKQTFTGAVRVSGVAVPVKNPVSVAIQPKGRAFEAVFMLNVELALLPAEILPKAGARPFEAVIQGVLIGDEDSKVNVSAGATLAIGSPKVEIPTNNIPAFFRFDGASLSGLGLKEVKGEARVVLFNPLSFDVNVREFRYQLIVGDKKLAEGMRTGVRLHKLRENTVTIPITVQNSDLVSALGVTVRNKGTVEGRLAGSLLLRSGGEDVPLSFNSAGTVQLLP